MTTAAKRARKKANKLKGRPKPEEQAGVAEEEMTTTATESEHAAALTALAQVKKMRKRAAG